MNPAFGKIRYGGRQEFKSTSLDYTGMGKKKVVRLGVQFIDG